MRRAAIAASAVMLFLSACDGASNGSASNEIASEQSRNETSQGQAGPPAPGTPGGLPDDRTPLAEPKGMIDPKSAEAAGQVVQHYGALIEQKRWNEANALWGDKTDAQEFASEIRQNREVHLEIGKPGNPDGAAGSVYVFVPVVLYGKDASGQPFRALRTVILRRVNNVPGSTAEQRRWHIFGLETGWEPQH